MTVASATAVTPTNNISVQVDTSKSSVSNAYASDPPNPWTVELEPHTYRFLALPGLKTDHGYFTEVISESLYDMIQNMHRQGRDTNERMPGNDFVTDAMAGNLKFQLADKPSNNYPFNAYLMSQVIHDMDELIYAYEDGLPALAFDISYKSNPQAQEQTVLHGTWLPNYAHLSRNHTGIALPAIKDATA